MSLSQLITLIICQNTFMPDEPKEGEKGKTGTLFPPIQQSLSDKTIISSGIPRNRFLGQNL